MDYNRNSRSRDDWRDSENRRESYYDRRNSDNYDNDFRSRRYRRDEDWPTYSLDQSDEYYRRRNPNESNDYRTNYGNDWNYSGSYRGSNAPYTDRNYPRYDDNNYVNNGDRRNRYQDRDWWDKTKDEVSSWFGDDEAKNRRRMDDIREGQNRGKGPKNYKRSEDRIREDVSDKLSDDDILDASDIEIEVSGSDVTLNGEVTSRYAKHRAEDIVEDVSGVTHVQNNLRVKEKTYSDTNTSYNPNSDTQSQNRSSTRKNERIIS